MDADTQLRVIGEIVRVCDEAGMPIWLRGGWAMEFFLGEVTRPHRDVDFFSGAADADRLVRLLHDLGCRDDPPSPSTPPQQQRDLVTPDGVGIGIALFARADDGCPTVAGGPYAGERWPADLLDGPVVGLGHVRCRIVHPRAQIEIKEMMPVWVPGLPRREKDAADIARLRAALTRA